MRALVDLVLPARCAGCDRPGSPACPACLSALAAPARLRWPTPSPPDLPPPYAVAAYADPVRAVLLAYKEQGVARLSGPLGIALAAAVAAGLAAHTSHSPVLLVPVPSSRAARRARGDDVVARLTRRAAADLRRHGHRVGVVVGLVHRRTVADSAGLTAGQRARNLDGAFRLRASAAALVGGATVVLTDDLVTTGASLAEGARTLRGAGANVIAAATVAATPRRNL